VDPAAAGIPENRRNEYWGYVAKFNPHMAVNWDPKKERFFSTMKIRLGIIINRHSLLYAELSLKWVVSQESRGYFINRPISACLQ
jgi:hypothetical protein